MSVSEERREVAARMLGSRDEARLAPPSESVLPEVTEETERLRAAIASWKGEIEGEIEIAGEIGRCGAIDGAGLASDTEAQEGAGALPEPTTLARAGASRCRASNRACEFGAEGGAGGGAGGVMAGGGCRKPEMPVAGAAAGAADGPGSEVALKGIKGSRSWEARLSEA